MEKEEEQQESTELWPLQGRQATQAAVPGGKGVVRRGLGRVFTGSFQAITLDPTTTE